jgi:hypothetical protein
LAAALLVAAPIISAMDFHNASAAQITSRSLTLQTGIDGADADTLPDGGSQPGGNSNHLFTFTLPQTGTNIGSIQFLYCTTASGSTGDISAASCTTPTGLNTAGRTLGAETGATGFSVDTTNSTNGNVILTRAASAPAQAALTYRLDGIINPTAVNETFFVRIKTYVSTDATTGLTDTGTVAASTARQIVLTGTMPESLVFCTGATITANGNIPDCSTATVGAVTFNQLFSPSDTARATSQMAASTNATNGYAITVSGGTLSSGSNNIPAMSSATTSIESTGQFGMNLVLNDEFCGVACDLGANISPGSNVASQLLANPVSVTRLMAPSSLPTK